MAITNGWPIVLIRLGGLLVALSAVASAQAQSIQEYVLVFKEPTTLQRFLVSEFEPHGGSKVMVLPDSVTQVFANAPASRTVRLFEEGSKGGSLVVLAGMSTDLAEELRADGRLIAVIPNESAEPLLDTSVPTVKASQAWSLGAKGEHVAVAVLDTGVDRNHPFLAGSVVLEACFSTSDPTKHFRSLCPGGGPEEYGQGSASPPPENIFSYYHGTHVAGIISGENGLTTAGNINGIGPAIDIVAIQVFRKSTSFAECRDTFRPCMTSSVYDQIKALEYVKQISKQYNIVAVNMSLGAKPARPPCDDNGYKAVIDELLASDIAVVVASGNDGKEGSYLPACVSTAVSVAATSDDDTFAPFSNYDDSIDVLAPGVHIVSSTPAGGYVWVDGTSMAAPHITAAIALMRQIYPNAPVSEIVRAIDSDGPTVALPGNLMKRRLDIGSVIKELAPFGQ